jgi:hypothetical protein
MAFSIVAAQVDEMWVTLTLGMINPMRRRFPNYRYLADHCNWSFKSVECAFCSLVKNGDFETIFGSETSFPTWTRSRGTDIDILVNGLSVGENSVEILPDTTYLNYLVQQVDDATREYKEVSWLGNGIGMITYGRVFSCKGTVKISANKLTVTGIGVSFLNLIPTDCFDITTLKIRFSGVNTTYNVISITASGSLILSSAFSGSVTNSIEYALFSDDFASLVVTSPGYWQGAVGELTASFKNVVNKFKGYITCWNFSDDTIAYFAKFMINSKENKVLNGGFDTATNSLPSNWQVDSLSTFTTGIKGMCGGGAELTPGTVDQYISYIYQRLSLQLAHVYSLLYNFGSPTAYWRYWRVILTRFLYNTGGIDYTHGNNYITAHDGTVDWSTVEVGDIVMIQDDLNLVDYDINYTTVVSKELSNTKLNLSGGIHPNRVSGTNLKYLIIRALDYDNHYYSGINNNFYPSTTTSPASFTATADTLQPYLLLMNISTTTRSGANYHGKMLIDNIYLQDNGSLYTQELENNLFSRSILPDIWYPRSWMKGSHVTIGINKFIELTNNVLKMKCDTKLNYFYQKLPLVANYLHLLSLSALSNEANVTFKIHLGRSFYNTGYVNTLGGSKTVIGISTTWLSDLSLTNTLYFMVEGDSTVYTVESINSDTNITLTGNANVTLFSKNYVLFSSEIVDVSCTTGLANVWVSLVDDSDGTVPFTPSISYTEMSLVIVNVDASTTRLLYFDDIKITLPDELQCKRTWDDCLNLFNNVRRFGGYIGLGSGGIRLV